MKLHLACYQAFDDIGSVIHSHPVWATMFAIAHQPIPACIDGFRHLLRRRHPLQRLHRVGHTRGRQQRGEGPGRAGRGADRQPRPGGGRSPAGQGATCHRPGRAPPPKSSGGPGLSADPLPIPDDVNANFAGVYTLSARQPDVAVPPPISGSRLTLFSSHAITTEVGALTTVRAAAVQLRPVLYSREGTVERVVAKIDELATRGVQFATFRRPLFPTIRTFRLCSPVRDARRASAADGTGSHRAVAGDAGDQRRRKPRRNGGLHRRERT